MTWSGNAAEERVGRIKVNRGESHRTRSARPDKERNEGTSPMAGRAYTAKKLRWPITRTVAGSRTILQEEPEL